MRGYLTGETANPVPGTTVSLDFQAPESEFLSVDDFEELPGDRHRRNKNSLGGTVIKRKRLTYDEVRLSVSAGAPLSSYRGETYGAQLFWGSRPDSVWLQKMPNPKKNPVDLSPYDYLSFRVGQLAGLNPQGDQDLRVRLTDNGKPRQSSEVAVSDFGRIFPEFPTAEGGVKTVMSSVRIPLAEFPSVDLDDLRQIEFVFDQTPRGALVLDDLRFTK
jgi:hypothetical protein